MSWEDVIKRQALVNHSNNAKWNRLSGLITSVDTQLSNLKRVVRGKKDRQHDISVQAIEDKWLDKINSSVMKFAYALEAHKKHMDKPKKPMPLPPKVTMTPRPEGEQTQLTDLWDKT